MKTNHFENTHRLYDKLKGMTFWQRIFGWSNVNSLIAESYAEFKSIDKEFDDLRNLENKIVILQKDIDNHKINEADLKAKIKVLEEKLADSSTKSNELEKEIAGYNKLKDKNKEDYEKKISELNELKKTLDEDRQRLQGEREQEINDRYERMKATWREHETKVEQAIKRICARHQIEYFDKEKVPFKGKPDNTIEISGQFIVFDAKSPQGENLDNFPNYIKDQREKVKKYISEQDVKKDIFLVIPSNTVDKFDLFSYNMADYTVYVITIDALEPVMLSLKRIEEYDFAEQLAPEDRDNICRIIGKFAHATKRRIQIDNFFSNEFIDILTKCETLPQDMLDKAVTYEKSDRLNPPIEKRAKQILTSDVKKDLKKIKQRANAEDINTEVNEDVFEDVPLYKE